MIRRLCGSANSSFLIVPPNIDFELEAARPSAIGIDTDRSDVAIARADVTQVSKPRGHGQDEIRERAAAGRRRAFAVARMRVRNRACHSRSPRSAVWSGLRLQLAPLPGGHVDASSVFIIETFRFDVKATGLIISHRRNILKTMENFFIVIEWKAHSSLWISAGFRRNLVTL